MNNKKILFHKLIDDSAELIFQRKGFSEIQDKDIKDNKSPEHTIFEKTTKSSNFYISPRSDMQKNALISNDLSTTNLTNTKVTNNNTTKFNSDDSIHENEFEDIGILLIIFRKSKL